MKNIQSFSHFLLEKTSTVVNDIINNKKTFRVNIGNSEYSNTKPDAETVVSAIKRFLNNYFFDRDFFYDTPVYQKIYKDWFQNHVEDPVLNDIDKFYAQYIDNKSDTWELKSSVKTKEIIANQFIKDRTIPDKLRHEWNLYRWKKYGEKNDPKRYQYIETGSTKTLKEK